MKKIFTLLIFALLLTSTVGYSKTSTKIISENSISVLSDERGDILYVGGTGPDNYTKIQDAIDDANIGDTVFVYDDSSPYYEVIVVDKQINLIGENKDSTIIIGDGEYNHVDVITILDDNTKINNFTIKLSGNVDDGISIRSDNNEIINCNIIENGFGIVIGNGCKNNIISDCYFQNNDEIAMYIQGWNEYASNNTILCCIFNGDEIELDLAKYTIISDCEIFDTFIGITFYASDNNEIINCHIHDVVQGISVREGGFNYVIKDCIIENTSLLEGISIDYMEDLQLINTTIANCSDHGVLISSYLANAVISGCRFINNELSGLSIGGLRNVEISNNHFEGNEQGLSLVNRNLFNFILQNNFINNEINIDPNPHGYFYYMINRFNNNYFDDWLGIGPYHVYGFLNWDFDPAIKPHNLN